VGKQTDGCRWIGSEEAVIDRDLVRTCAETEAGRVLSLNFHFKYLREISGLEQYATNLHSLDLSYNNIREVEGLRGMGKLRELKLYGCQIGRIAGLEPCTYLVSLHLDDNCISNIEGLDATRVLEYLNLDGNKIMHLGKGLSRLSKLKELRISRNGLTSLEGLAGLCSLEVLDASHNRIQNVAVEHIKMLSKIDELSLRGNQLESLNFLRASPQPLPLLATLDASSNKLTSKGLEGMPKLPQMAELNLAGNGIANICPATAASWHSIEILDLSENQLSDATSIRHLKALSSLRELSLLGNPMSAEPAEMNKVVAELQGLEFLDKRPAPLPATDPIAPEEDTNTFSMTRTGFTGFRPSSGPRPSSSASRPSTGQSLKDGTGDPLMYSRIKMSEKRFATMEQAMEWEKQTLSGLAAIGRQIQKTSDMAAEEFERMDQCVSRAQHQRKQYREMKARGCPADPAELPEDEGEAEPPSPSRAGRRMREAMVMARAGCEDDEQETDNATSVDDATRQSCAKAEFSQASFRARRWAGCDEVIEEELGGASTPGVLTDAEDEEIEVVSEDKPWTNRRTAATEEQRRLGAPIARCGPRSGRPPRLGTTKAR
jgi:Leucine-rich repeat (LRR) protein